MPLLLLLLLLLLGRMIIVIVVRVRTMRMLPGPTLVLPMAYPPCLRDRQPQEPQQLMSLLRGSVLCTWTLVTWGLRLATQAAPTAPKGCC